MRFVQIITLIFLIAGCLNEPDCIVTSTNLVKISFKKDSKTAREITFTKINVLGLTTDFYAEQKVSQVALPVSPETEDATFIFNYENRIDTIHVTYTRKTQIISSSCGAYTNYGDLFVSESSFEPFKITNNQLLINAPSNIEVFLE